MCPLSKHKCKIHGSWIYWYAANNQTNVGFYFFPPPKVWKFLNLISMSTCSCSFKVRQWAVQHFGGQFFEHDGMVDCFCPLTMGLYCCCSGEKLSFFLICTAGLLLLMALWRMCCCNNRGGTQWTISPPEQDRLSPGQTYMSPPTNMATRGKSKITR